MWNLKPEFKSSEACCGCCGRASIDWFKSHKWRHAQTQSVGASKFFLPTRRHYPSMNWLTANSCGWTYKSVYVEGYVGHRYDGNFENKTKLSALREFRHFDARV